VDGSGTGSGISEQLAQEIGLVGEKEQQDCFRNIPYEEELHLSKGELYMEFLKEEGYMPRFDEDGDIVFKSEGVSYLLFASEDDREYFRLALPFFWKIEDAEERRRVLAAAAQVNAELKVVKVYPVDDNTWASIELLFHDPEQFKPIFKRALRVLRHGAERFAEIMRTPVQ